MRRMATAMAILIVIAACGGGGGDGGSVAVPVEHTPKITNAVTTNGDGVEQSLFEVGDSYNILVYATDDDMDMSELLINEYRYSLTDQAYLMSFSDYAELPSQSGVSMKYFFIKNGIIDIYDIGSWKIEFQIVDKEGNESNVFTVFVEVESDGSGTPSAGPDS